MIKKINYSFIDNKLIIEESKVKIKYNINDYDESLINRINIDNAFLTSLWENDSLNSFQSHNFLSFDDIELIKGTITKIFKSKFWKEILISYCDNDVTKIDNFQSDEFIHQFIEKLIFIPFNAKCKRFRFLCIYHIR